MTLAKDAAGGQGLSVYQVPTPGVIYFLRYAWLKVWSGGEGEGGEGGEGEKQE